MATQQIASSSSSSPAPPIMASPWPPSAGPTPVINTTCAALANSPNFTLHVEYKFCVGALSADPAASPATDARGLAAAAASLAVANMTSTELNIADLVPNLGHCLADYKEVNGMVRRGLDDFRAGHAVDPSEKFLEAAESDVPSLCDLILIEGDGKRNPIDRENQNPTSCPSLPPILPS